MSRGTMSTTRTPGRAMAAGAAALVLALAACGGAEDAEDAPVEDPPAAQEPSDQGGDDDTADSSESEGSDSGGSESGGPDDGADDDGEDGGAEDSESIGDDGDDGSEDDAEGGPGAAVASFDEVTLGPMGEGGNPDVQVSPEDLAETIAEMSGVDPGEVTCDDQLTSGSETPVTCTIGANGEEYTVYPVFGGTDGTEAYQLIVRGTLDQETEEMVFDPRVSMHYGPTELFFDDSELVEGEDLQAGVQGELDNLGIGVEVGECEGTVGDGDEQTPVVCSGHREGSEEDATVRVELHAALSGSGDPVSVVLVEGQA